MIGVVGVGGGQIRHYSNVKWLVIVIVMVLTIPSMAYSVVAMHHLCRPADGLHMYFSIEFGQQFNIQE